MKRYGLPLGKEALLGAITTLNSVDGENPLNRKKEIARCLLITTIMLCEGRRFGPLGFYFCFGSNTNYQTWMWELLVLWSKLSRRLREYFETGKTHFDELKLSVEDATGWVPGLGEFTDMDDVDDILRRVLPPADLDTSEKILFTLEVMKDLSRKKEKKGDISPDQAKDLSSESKGGPSKPGKKRGGWPDGGSSSSKHGIKTSGLTDRGHGGVRKRRSVVTHDGITGTVRSPADDDDGALETTEMPLEGFHVLVDAGNEAAKIFAKSVGEESHMAVETTDLGGLKRKSLA